MGVCFCLLCVCVCGFVDCSRARAGAPLTAGSNNGGGVLRLGAIVAGSSSALGECGGCHGLRQGLGKDLTHING